MRILTLLLVTLAGLAAAEPEVVPPEVAKALKAAEAEADPAQSLAKLHAYSGKPHPLLQLALGDAAERAALAAGADRAGLLTAAEAAYRAARESASHRRAATRGLAQVSADREDWKSALTLAAEAVDPATATADELRFEAELAARAGDARLATVVVEQGLMRFPEDAGLRRLDFATAVRGRRFDDARQAALAVLARAPDDAALWRELAWVEQERRDEPGRLAALEAAHLAAPGDAELARALGEAQLAAREPQAALRTLAPLVGDAATVDPRLVLAGASAAAGAGDLPRARAWLAAIPAEHRDRATRLMSARLAVEAGDLAAADAALGELVAQGEDDALTLTWAGHLADRRGDGARAEALYRQALAGHGDAGSATLRLVALLHRQGRDDEALKLIVERLARHPEDGQAEAMKALLSGK